MGRGRGRRGKERREGEEKESDGKEGSNQLRREMAKIGFSKR